MYCAILCVHLCLSICHSHVSHYSELPVFKSLQYCKNCPNTGSWEATSCYIRDHFYSLCNGPNHFCLENVCQEIGVANLFFCSWCWIKVPFKLVIVSHNLLWVLRIILHITERRNEPLLLTKWTEKVVNNVKWFILVLFHTQIQTKLIAEIVFNPCFLLFFLWCCILWPNSD